MKRTLAIAVMLTATLGLSYAVCTINEAYRHLKELYSAAERGDASAETQVGAFYYKGHPFYQGDAFPQDFAKAMKWWRSAADQGYGDAQFDVGHMYWFGEGIPQNAIQAYKWTLLAAQHGCER